MKPLLIDAIARVNLFRIETIKTQKVWSVYFVTVIDVKIATAVDAFSTVSGCQININPVRWHWISHYTLPTHLQFHLFNPLWSYELRLRTNRRTSFGLDSNWCSWWQNNWDPFCVYLSCLPSTWSWASWGGATPMQAKWINLGLGMSYGSNSNSSWVYCGWLLFDVNFNLVLSSSKLPPRLKNPSNWSPNTIKNPQNLETKLKVVRTIVPLFCASRDNIYSTYISRHGHGRVDRVTLAFHWS